MYRVAFVSLGALSLSGCVFSKYENPHNDVMFFGTATKLAADVTLAPEAAGVPEITIGYKRTEAVWMPLRPNYDDPQHRDQADYNADNALERSVGEAQEIADALTDCSTRMKEAGVDSAAIPGLCLSIVLPAKKYVSVAAGVNDGGVEIDTYSVFASFGAKGRVGSGGGGGALAQIFATGVAAQRLAENESIASVLNTESPEAESKKAEAEKAKLELALKRLSIGEAIESSLEEYRPCFTPFIENVAFTNVVDRSRNQDLDENATDATTSENINDYWTFLMRLSSYDQVIDDLADEQMKSDIFIGSADAICDQ
ncbi:MAG: hypothetical protein AAFX52_13130 [Pseudomonadota bacterium]